MIINHREGKFLCEEDDISATITTPLFECDICRARITDPFSLHGHIGYLGFRMDHCQHHTYEEVLETLRQIPIQNQEAIELKRDVPSHMQLGHGGMGG